MGGQIKVDKVQLEIQLKSDPIRKEIRELEDDVKSFSNEFKKLNNQFKQQSTDMSVLKTDLSRLSKEYKVLSAANDETGMSLKKMQITETKLKMTELQKSIDATKNSMNAVGDKTSEAKTKIDSLRNGMGLMNLTIKELEQKAKILGIQLRNAIPDSPEQKRYAQELNEISNRISTLRGKSKDAEGFFSTFTGGINKVFYALIPLITLLTSFGYAIGQVVQKTAELEDVYADVSKTTGLTHDQVAKLNEDFKKVDTRTTRVSLNQLAVDAGKLGIEGRKNILDFVDAGNQINVALGEDLGADAVKNIGKMVGVFDKVTTQLKDKDLKGQMLAVGSAVNSLGQASSASESYLVDFAGRLGGVSAQAKLSLADVLGFASQLDQDMQHVEMAATSFQQFILKMMSDPAKFAKIAGLDIKKFTDLLSKDTNAAIKELLTALNQGGGFAKLIPVFQEMKLDGARAVGVLSSMAASIGKIDEAQKLSNKSMADGTSITKEYNIKNNNFAASLEKAKKEFLEASYALGQSLIPLVTSLSTGVIGLSKGFIELLKWLGENKGLLLTLTITMTAYTVAVNAATLADKGKALVVDILNSKTIQFFKTLLTNPYVALGVAVASLTVLLYKLSTAQTVGQQAWKEYSKQAGEEVANSNRLFDALKNASASTAERKKLIDKINEVYGQYLPNLLTEKSSLDEIKFAQDNVNISLREKIGLQIKEQKSGEIVKQAVDDQISNMEKLNDYIAKKKGKDFADVVVGQIKDVFANTSDLEEATRSANKILMSYMGDNMGSGFATQFISNFANSIRNEKTGLAELDKVFSGMMPKNPLNIYMPNDHKKPDNKSGLPTTGDDEKEKAQRKRLNAALNELDADYYRRLENLKRDYIKGDIATEADYKNELDKQEDAYYIRKVAALQKLRKTMSSASVIADIDKKIAESNLKLLDNQMQRHTQYLKVMREGISNIIIIEESAYKQRLVDAGIFEKDFSELTIEQRTKREQLEKEHWDRLRKASVAVEQLRYDDEVKQYGLIGVLTDEQQKQLEVLTTKHESNILTINQTGDANLKKSKEQLASDAVKFLDETQQNTEYAITQGYETQQLLLKEGLASMLITQIQYDRADRKNQLEAAKAKLTLAENVYMAMQTIEFADSKTKEDNLRKARQNIAAIKNIIKGLNIEISNDRKDFTDILTERIQTASEKWNKIFSGVSQNVANMFSTMDAASKAFKNGDLKSWTDWGTTIGSIAAAALQVASEISAQYFQYKAAALETDKQKELTANEEKFKHGLESEEDYKKQKEKLDNDYAQKELDLKKEQSSSDTKLKIAQATVAGGLAIIQAYAQLGPIFGTAAALLIGGITAFQISTMLKQDAAIQATTLASSTSSSSSTTQSTGARVVTQAADGRYDVIGAQDRKRYNNVRYAGNARTGLVTTPTLYGEAGTELVISAPDLKRLNMKAPGFNNFVLRNRVSQRADGNYTSAGNATSTGNDSNYQVTINANTAVMGEVLSYLQFLKANGIEAFVLLDQLQKAQELQARSKAKGSLK